MVNDSYRYRMSNRENDFETNWSLLRAKWQRYEIFLEIVQHRPLYDLIASV